MRCKIHGAVHADELSRPRIAGTLVWVMFQICTLPSLFPRPGYCLHGTGHCTAWHWLMTAHWAGAERRLSESDASWVRSVFADGEVSLIDLLKCHDENLTADHAVQQWGSTYCRGEKNPTVEHERPMLHERDLVCKCKSEWKITTTLWVRLYVKAKLASVSQKRTMTLLLRVKFSLY